MIVDDELITTARRLLEARFPDREGRAAAMYGASGRMYTGVSVPGSTPETGLAPETGPLCEAYKRADLIMASVTVGWKGPGTPIWYLSPGGASLDRLVQCAHRDAQIVVHDFFDKANIVVKPLRELVPYHVTEAAIDQVHHLGMKAIGAELVALSRVRGVPAARERFPSYFAAGLRDATLARAWAKRSYNGDAAAFVLPIHLESIALRQLWFAFEAATLLFIDDFVNGERGALEGLGANDSDIFHVKQGGEALRHVFGNLLVLVETRSEIPNELPFRPYHSHKLKVGVPMHQAIALPPPIAPDDPDRQEALVRQVSAILCERGAGGMAAYLRQRQLFGVDVFRGHGPGQCPFALMATQVLVEAAAVLEVALADGVIAGSRARSGADGAAREDSASREPLGAGERRP